MWDVCYLCWSIDRLTEQAHVNANTNNFTVTVSALPSCLNIHSVCVHGTKAVFLWHVASWCFTPSKPRKVTLGRSVFMKCFPFCKYLVGRNCNNLTEKWNHDMKANTGIKPRWICFERVLGTMSFNKNVSSGSLAVDLFILQELEANK